MPAKARSGGSSENPFAHISSHPGNKPARRFSQFRSACEGVAPALVNQPNKSARNHHPMKKSTRLLITAAALSGLYTGALAVKSYGAAAAGSEQKDEKKG